MRLVKYKNGNYIVIRDLDSGTLVKVNDLDFLEADFPDSFDLKITNCCDMGCKFCLKPSAKLYVEGDEAKNIVNINLGDKVLSYNADSKKCEYKNVIRKYEREYKGDLICIYIDENTMLECTPNHKIYTQRGYIRADELKETDMLLIFDYDKKKN